MNYYETLEEWAASRPAPELFQMIFRQQHPLPTERFDLELFRKPRKSEKSKELVNENVE